MYCESAINNLEVDRFVIFLTNIHSLCVYITAPHREGWRLPQISETRGWAELASRASLGRLMGTALRDRENHG